MSQLAAYSTSLHNNPHISSSGETIQQNLPNSSSENRPNGEKTPEDHKKIVFIWQVAFVKLYSSLTVGDLGVNFKRIYDFMEKVQQDIDSVAED